MTLAEQGWAERGVDWPGNLRPSRESAGAWRGPLGPAQPTHPLPDGGFGCRERKDAPQHRQESGARNRERVMSGTRKPGASSTGERLDSRRDGRTRSTGAGYGVPRGAAKPAMQRPPQPATGESRDSRPETQERGSRSGQTSASGVTAGETALSMDRENRRGVERTLEGHVLEKNVARETRARVRARWSSQPQARSSGAFGVRVPTAGIKPGRRFSRSVFVPQPDGPAGNWQEVYRSVRFHP